MILVILVLIIGSFVYPTDITLRPDGGPESFKVRCTTSIAEKYPSKDPNVVPVIVTSTSADISSTETNLDVRLKDNTSANTVTDPLASTHTAASNRSSPDTNVNLYVTLPQTLHGTNIKTAYDCAGRPDLLRTTQQDPAVAGEAKAIDITGDRLNIDYGQVAMIPTIFLRPSAPCSTKTFTMNRQKVISTNNVDGRFSNPPFDQLITATGQASPTGTIDLDNGILSVIDLVAGDTKDFTPEATAPVVHTVADYQSAGLATFQLSNQTTNTNNVADPWLIFTRNNGT